MSLILDALRKSEAERRKATPVDALADTPAAIPRARAGMPPWVWPLALATGMALASWLAWGDRGGAGRPVPDALPSSESPEAMMASAPVASTTASAPALAGATAPAFPPQETRTVAAPATVTRTSSTPPATAATQPVRAPAPAPAPAATSALTPVSASASAPAVASAPLAAPIAAPLPAPMPASPAGNAATAAASPTAAPSAGSQAATAPIRLSDLGTAERQQLPPLKMSMHMWGPDAGKRFAIIDGNRVGEGDRVGASVVESIDENGVVLGWNGHRVRVPVR